MCPSAIQTPTFQALAGNIKNADAITPIYGAGAWDFKNASGTTTLAVSSAGAVTVGGTSLSVAHSVRSASNVVMNMYTAGTECLVGLYTATNSLQGFIGSKAGVPFQVLNNSGTQVVGSCTTAGAWMLGRDGTGELQWIYGALRASIAVSGASALYHQIETSTLTGSTEVLRLKRHGLNATSNASWMKFDWYTSLTGHGEIATNGSSQFVLTTPSDVRMKKDIKDATYGLATIQALRPVEFKWLSQEDSPVVKGFIAQEVKTVLPESVSISNGGSLEDSHSLETVTMIPVLVKAVQELSAKLDEANAKIAALEAK